MTYHLIADEQEELLQRHVFAVEWLRKVREAMTRFPGDPQYLTTKLSLLLVATVCVELHVQLQTAITIDDVVEQTGWHSESKVNRLVVESALSELAAHGFIEGAYLCLPKS